MIVWCAYCQRFLGERPPFEDLAVTHGICETCEEDASIASGNVAPGVREIAVFFSEVLTRSVHGDVPDPDALWEAGRRLGIRHVDLLLGIVQPALYEIGRLFAEGRLPTAREHRLSEGVEELLVRYRVARERPTSPAPRVLLETATGNAHRIGVLIFAQVLAEEGLVVDVPPLEGHPSWAELVASEVPYACVGISIAMPSQLPAAREMAAMARRARPRVVTLLGGYVTKDSDQLGDLSAFDRVADPADTLAEARALRRLLTTLGGPLD